MVASVLHGVGALHGDGADPHSIEAKVLNVVLPVHKTPEGAPTILVEVIALPAPPISGGEAIRQHLRPSGSQTGNHQFSEAAAATLLQRQGSLSQHSLAAFIGKSRSPGRLF